MGKHNGPYPNPRMPYSALEDYVSKLGIATSSLWPAVSIKRWRAEGVPYYTADKAACDLGLHPSQVWRCPVAGWWATTEQLDKAFLRDLIRKAVAA